MEIIVCPGMPQITTPSKDVYIQCRFFFCGCFCVPLTMYVRFSLLLCCLSFLSALIVRKRCVCGCVCVGNDREITCFECYVYVAVSVGG